MKSTSFKTFYFKVYKYEIKYNKNNCVAVLPTSKALSYAEDEWPNRKQQMATHFSATAASGQSNSTEVSGSLELALECTQLGTAHYGE